MQPGGEIMFQVVPVMIGIIFLIVFSIIVFSVTKGLSEWSNNNQSPEQKVKAKVIGKRTAIRGGGESRAYSLYYITFQVEEGDRMELKVKDNDYGMIIEGDRGELIFQGSRFLGFHLDSAVNEG